MKRNGFTLIEMMIVVAIVGIMATYVSPNFSNQIASKQVGEGIGLAELFQSEITAYYQQNGRFPRDNAALGMPPPDKMLGNYVTGIAVENGAIHITLGNYIHKQIEHKVLTLRPMVVEGSPKSPIGWSCGYRQPPPGMKGIGTNKTDVYRLMVPLNCRS